MGEMLITAVACGKELSPGTKPRALDDLNVCSGWGFPGTNGAALTFATDSFVFLFVVDPTAATT